MHRVVFICVYIYIYNIYIILIEFYFYELTISVNHFLHHYLASHNLLFSLS